MRASVETMRREGSIAMLAGERSSLFKAYKAGRPARLIRTVRPTTIRFGA